MCLELGTTFFAFAVKCVFLKNILDFGVVYVDCLTTKVRLLRLLQTSPDRMVFFNSLRGTNKPRNGAQNLLRETQNSLRGTSNHSNVILTLLRQTQNLNKIGHEERSQQIETSNLQDLLLAAGPQTMIVDKSSKVVAQFI